MSRWRGERLGRRGDGVALAADGARALAPLTLLPDGDVRRHLLEQLVTGQLSAAELHLEVTRLRRGASSDRTLDQRLKSALPQIRGLRGERRLRAERLIDQLLELAEQGSSHAGNGARE